MPLQQTYLSHNQQLLTHYYLCHYLPASSGKDILSHSLLKFKKGRQPDLDGWIDCALEIFAEAPIPPNGTIIIALHHQETAVSTIPVALDLLGQELAARLHCQYHPRLLEKTQPNTPIKSFSKPRREEELQGLYRVNTSYAASLPDQPTHWVILDDILTSGATVRAIIQAIREASPSLTPPITLFTLAKAGAPKPQDPPLLKGQNYQIEEGLGWTLAEPPLPFYTLSQLKNRIRIDTF